MTFVDGVARGGIGSVMMLTVSALLPGPVLVGFVVGVVAAMLARHAYNMGRAKIAESGVGATDLVGYVMRAVSWMSQPAPLLLPALYPCSTPTTGSAAGWSPASPLCPLPCFRPRATRTRPARRKGGGAQRSPALPLP